MHTKKELLQQRKQVEQLRTQSSLNPQHAEKMEQSIASSWERSSLADIPKERLAAPLSNQLTEPRSSLSLALQACREDLKHIAEQSSMVLAVGDMGSTIIWTASCTQMRNAAEQVHFVAGGQWQEELVGTNALALSLKTRKSSCVFSNEHYMASVHDWVCYAAPIIDPYSKQVLGVVDLSTTWENHNSLGLLAVERCAAILQMAVQELQQQHLYFRTLNTAQVLLNGRNLTLTPRQIEILVILALCPQGLNLENLHQALYGERKVSIGTLKAEMSHLRDRLGDALGSRPYRLNVAIEADFLQLEQALDAGYISTALQCYTGIFLAKTESPFLCAWRDGLESRLSHAIFQTQGSDVLLKHLAYSPEAVDAAERLLELLPASHPAKNMLSKYHDH
ncbi:transcriptional regulator [Acinetobacter gyllenbergii]|uniref:transcriptional regulator n=1 Tax=Acinetobacter gyllenbergii TaxID=134534 RepID=UPI000806EF9B|nr:transcriptional regulator [Acinetobacter gyllenbergii]OBY75710.1 transcriptional regulator [Acinetobacter gyllenbergii]